MSNSEICGLIKQVTTSISITDIELNHILSPTLDQSAPNWDLEDHIAASSKHLDDHEDLQQPQKPEDEDHMKELQDDMNIIMILTTTTTDDDDDDDDDDKELQKKPFISIPQYNYSSAVDVDDDDDENDGFRTPTSLDHRIPLNTKCPPPPRKIRKRKLSSSPTTLLLPQKLPSLDRDIDVSKEIESIMFPHLQQHRGCKIKKACRDHEADINEFS